MDRREFLKLLGAAATAAAAGQVIPELPAFEVVPHPAKAAQILVFPDQSTITITDYELANTPGLEELLRQKVELAIVGMKEELERAILIPKEE